MATISVPATQIADDTIDGLRFGETSDSSSGLSFLSYVAPIGDFRIALYRHEVANFESSFGNASTYIGPFSVTGAPNTTGPVPIPVRTFPIDSRLELDIENIGASFAYKFGDNFSVGIGVSRYEIDAMGLTQRFDADAQSLQDFFTAVPKTPANVRFTQTLIGDDDDIGINAGLLWRMGKAVSVGLVYKQGAEFDLSYVVTQTGSGPLDVTGDPRFNLPDSYGIGFAFRPSTNFTITLDVNEIEYSDLATDIAVVANAPGVFEADDATEVHLGFEYRFANLRYPVFLRAGAWDDPAHNIRRRSQVLDPNGTFTFSDFTNNVLGESINQTVWSATELVDDEIHYSAGIGINFGSSFTLDLAADFSELIDTAALSGVIRF